MALLYNNIWYPNIPMHLGCTCKDLVNEEGMGNCQGTPSVHFKRVACYVNQPTSCKDARVSGKKPGEKYSAEACSRGMYTLNVTTVEEIYR